MASTRLLRVLQTSALSRVAVARICPTASDGNIARPHPSSNQSGLLKCFGPPSPWQSASLGPATSCVSRTLHTSPPSHFDPFGLFNAVTAVAERVQERFKDASVLLLPPELPHNPMTGKMKELKDVFSDLRKKNRGAAVTMYVNCQEFPSVATQLARDFGGEYYSKERRLPKRSRVVATLDASSEDSLERSYYELAKRLNCDIGMYNLEVKTFTQNYEQRLSAIVNEVKAKLRERAGWLLIIHNDNSNSALSTLCPLPGSKDWGEGFVLVTGSNITVKKGNPAVGELIIEEAANYLTSAENEELKDRDRSWTWTYLPDCFNAVKCTSIFLVS